MANFHRFSRTNISFYVALWPNTHINKPEFISLLSPAWDAFILLESCFENSHLTPAQNKTPESVGVSFSYFMLDIMSALSND